MGRTASMLPVRSPNTATLTFSCYTGQGRRSPSPDLRCICGEGRRNCVASTGRGRVTRSAVLRAGARRHGDSDVVRFPIPGRLPLSLDYLGQPMAAARAARTPTRERYWHERSSWHAVCTFPSGPFISLGSHHPRISTDISLPRPPLSPHHKIWGFGLHVSGQSLIKPRGPTPFTVLKTQRGREQEGGGKQPHQRSQR